MKYLWRLGHSVTRGIWRPLCSRELRPRFVDYLTEVAAPAMGCAELGALDAPEAQGRNTLVLRWQPEAQGTLYARAWRYDRIVRPAREHRLAAELLRAAGLRTPEVAWHDDSWPTLRRWRLECAVERAAAGVPLARIVQATNKNPPLAVVEQFARELAALHGVGTWRGVAAEWGKPWRPINEMRSPRAYWEGRLAKLRERIPGRTRQVNAATVLAALDRLAAMLGSIAIGGPALVHGDLAAGHLFIEGNPDADPRITWIDFGTVHFGHAANDLAAVRGWLDETNFERLLAIYAAARGIDVERLLPGVEFFATVKWLEKLSTRITKARERRKKDAGAPDAPSTRHDEELEQLESKIARRHLLSGD